MHARIVGHEEVVGEVLKPVTVFGNKVSRDWSEVTLTDDQVTKLKGNPHIELHDGADEPEEAAPKSRAHKPKAD